MFYNIIEVSPLRISDFLHLTTELDPTLKVYFTTPTQTLPVGIVRFLPTEVSNRSANYNTESNV